MAFQVSFIYCSPELQSQVLELVRQWNDFQDTYETKTSGSTGNPKAVQLTRKQLEASALRSNQYFNLSENSHALLCMNPSTIGGKMVIIRALVGNYKLTVVPASGNPLIELNDSEPFDFASLVPYQLNRILSENPDKLSNFHQILLGGMPLSTKRENELLQLQPTFFIGFGMTETVSHIAIRQIGEQRYTCLEGVSIDEIDDHRLVISDQHLGIERLETTDIVKIYPPNQFEWLGRRDFAINSGGIKIHPEALEKELTTLILSPFIIAGIPDTTLHEMCVLISEKTLSEVQQAEIKQEVTRVFGKYAVPKKFFVSPILLRENGKIDRFNTIKQLHYD